MLVCIIHQTNLSQRDNIGIEKEPTATQFNPGWGRTFRLHRYFYKHLISPESFFVRRQRVNQRIVFKKDSPELLTSYIQNLENCIISTDCRIAFL